MLGLTGGLMAARPHPLRGDDVARVDAFFDQIMASLPHGLP